MAALERPTSVQRLRRSGQVEFRWERASDEVVLVFHGGHMRAALAVGESTYADRGCSLLVPSRPGYGQTPLETGTSPSGFADVAAKLCRHLGVRTVAAVVGISAGGRTALAMARRHPDLVRRLILESSVGFGSYPDLRTRLAAQAVFHPAVEGMTWRAVRALLKAAPATGLRLMLGSLSTKPAREVLAAVGDEDRDTLVALFSRMRSGSGFLNDLHHTRPTTPRVVDQPTLVIASRRDGGVPFAHAESLVATIPQAELVVSDADTHLVWFDSEYASVADRIGRFLRADPATWSPS